MEDPARALPGAQSLEPKRGQAVAEPHPADPTHLAFPPSVGGWTPYVRQATLVDVAPIDVALSGAGPAVETRSRGRRLLMAAAGLMLLVCAASAAAVLAQEAGRRFRVREGAGAFPPQYPPKDFEDGNFTLCKLQYSGDRFEAMGIGWSTDYPYAGVNLMIRLSELTRTRITTNADGEPNYWVVRLTDAALFRCPILMASDVGTMELSDEEAARLREYLLKGGFLWVDDFWGTPAWSQWVAQIHKALPEGEIFDIPPEHQIRHMMFPVGEIEQVTNIQNWLRTGDTSERGADSPHADFRGIADERGRLIVVMTHNTDFGDTWERESENKEFFEQFSPKGYALGINVLLYALTH